MHETYTTSRSSNFKTGDVPTVWVGSDYESSKKTCDVAECPLRPWAQPEGSKGNMLCYAWAGTPVMAFSSILRASRNGADHSMEYALKHRHPGAKIVRVGAIGDPGVLPWGWWHRTRRLAKKHGLEVVAYSHAWRKRPDLAGWIMASCDSFEDATEAHRMGFRAAIATREVTETSRPITLPDGRRAVVCPAIAAKARGGFVSCNDCGLCNAGRAGPDILFPDHGPTSRSRTARGGA